VIAVMLATGDPNLEPEQHDADYVSDPNADPDRVPMIV
jgi:hypothetical protein